MADTGDDQEEFEGEGDTEAAAELAAAPTAVRLFVLMECWNTLTFIYVVAKKIFLKLNNVLYNVVVFISLARILAMNVVKCCINLPSG